MIKLLFQSPYLYTLIIGIYMGLLTQSFAVSAEVSQKYSISSFLAETREKMDDLKNSETAPAELIHVVLGNQSGDMDSIVSAITFSYVNRTKGYIPVINIMREDLILRGDVLYVFERLNIDPDTLLYQEDLQFLLKLAEKGKVRITLVDHNHLAPDQEAFENYVELIVDHHKDEEVLYPLLREKEKVIAAVASNSTLIGELILLGAPQESSPEVAYLLLSAILLDTRNLTNTLIMTERDIEIATQLKEKAEGYYDETLFDTLTHYRYEVEHLSPDLLLKKDYKFYKEGKLLYGIAAIPKGVDWTAANRSKWQESFSHAFKKQNLHLYSALAYEGNDRIWIAYIPSLDLQHAFLNHLQQTPRLRDELILNAYFPEEGFFFFRLKNPLARKQVQPLFSFEKSCHIQSAL